MSESLHTQPIPTPEESGQQPAHYSTLTERLEAQRSSAQLPPQEQEQEQEQHQIPDEMRRVTIQQMEAYDESIRPYTEISKNQFLALWSLYDPSKPDDRQNPDAATFGERLWEQMIDVGRVSPRTDRHGKSKVNHFVDSKGKEIGIDFSKYAISQLEYEMGGRPQNTAPTHPGELAPNPYTTRPRRLGKKVGSLIMKFGSREKPEPDQTGMTISLNRGLIIVKHPRDSIRGPGTRKGREDLLEWKEANGIPRIQTPEEHREFRRHAREAAAREKEEKQRRKDAK